MKYELLRALERNKTLIDRADEMLDENFISNFNQAFNKLQYCMIDQMLRAYIKDKNLDKIEQEMSKLILQHKGQTLSPEVLSYLETIKKAVKAFKTLINTL